eukprot:SAG11_NODE_16289_length_552_cov_0.750552_1_plen_83_part_10
MTVRGILPSWRCDGELGGAAEFALALPHSHRHHMRVRVHFVYDCYDQWCAGTISWEPHLERTVHSGQTAEWAVEYEFGYLPSS